LRGWVMMLIFAILSFAFGMSVLVQAFADPEPLINAGRFVHTAFVRKADPTK
jgi:hypothetical protein